MPRSAYTGAFTQAKPAGPVHGPASDKNNGNGEVRVEDEVEAGGGLERRGRKKRIAKKKKHERYRIVPGPMRAMPIPNPYWSASSREIVPPKANASPMCWGGVGPVSAVSSTGNERRQHIKMGHTLSRISTVAICI